jgi:hypothetical protein
MTQCATYENSTVPPQGIELVLVSIRREVHVGFLYDADTVRDSRNLRMTFPASKMSASIAAEPDIVVGSRETSPYPDRSLLSS